MAPRADQESSDPISDRVGRSDQGAGVTGGSRKPQPSSAGNRLADGDGSRQPHCNGGADQGYFKLFSSGHLIVSKSLISSREVASSISDPYNRQGAAGGIEGLDQRRRVCGFTGQ